jgi:hypothetical protein
MRPRHLWWPDGVVPAGLDPRRAVMSNDHAGGLPAMSRHAESDRYRVPPRCSGKHCGKFFVKPWLWLLNYADASRCHCHVRGAVGGYWVLAALPAGPWSEPPQTMIPTVRAVLMTVVRLPGSSRSARTSRARHSLSPPPPPRRSPPPVPPASASPPGAGASSLCCMPPRSA